MKLSWCHGNIRGENMSILVKDRNAIIGYVRPDGGQFSACFMGAPIGLFASSLKAMVHLIHAAKDAAP